LDNLSISELKLASLNFQNAAIATNFQNSFVSATNPNNSDDKLEKLFAKFCEAVESLEQPQTDVSDTFSAFDQLIDENLGEFPNIDITGTGALFLIYRPSCLDSWRRRNYFGSLLQWQHFGN
jgi:hypothetical protein